MLFALENAIQTEAKSGRAPTATHTFIRLYRVHKPRLHVSTPRARRRRNRKPHTAVAPHYGAAAETTHIVASASARPRAGSSWRRDPEPVRGWRRMWRPCTRASTRLEQRLCHEMHSAARGATRARRERAFGAARSGAPERRRPQSCTTRRQAPAVSARRRLTDTAAPTHPWTMPACTARVRGEAHPMLSQQARMVRA